MFLNHMMKSFLFIAGPWQRKELCVYKMPCTRNPIFHYFHCLLTSAEDIIEQLLILGNQQTGIWFLFCMYSVLPHCVNCFLDMGMEKVEKYFDEHCIFCKQKCSDCCVVCQIDICKGSRSIINIIQEARSFDLSIAFL